MSDDDRRVVAASMMRELGHAFVGHDFSDAQLDDLIVQLHEQSTIAGAAPVRVRAFSREDVPLTIPTFDEVASRQLFTDSFVFGAANPMGLAARLWREGDVACMQVTLGKAFEGAPGRAHGGVVAALLDEVMGVMNVIHGAMAFTAHLNITYHAATPLGEPIVARAWLTQRDDRKHFVEATLHADELLVASADALFITIDRAKFLERHLAKD